jgi:hypothetical protein
MLTCKWQQKKQLLQKGKAMSQGLCVWRPFLTSFFQGKSSKTISIVVEKVLKEKNW